MMRVLIIKTSSMGDVLHTLPSLTDAVKEIPGIRFDWALEEEFAEIPSWHSAVERIIPLAIRRWRKAWFSAPVRAERREFCDAVRIHHYDAIIDAQGLVKSAALVTCLARGIKHGMDWLTVREPLASLFYNRRHHIVKKQHAVKRTRELFARSLGYAEPQTQGDYAIARHFLRAFTPVKAPYIVFLHATTRDDKRWPETSWRELIKLIQPCGIRIKLLWGAEYERQRAERLAAGFNHVDILPKLSLATIAEQLMGAQAVVSVDTGLSHLAAALDRPNITLFGPTDPGLIGGYGKNQHQVVSTIKRMADIAADEIFTRLNDSHIL